MAEGNRVTDEVLELEEQLTAVKQVNESLRRALEGEIDAFEGRAEKAEIRRRDHLAAIQELRLSANVESSILAASAATLSKAWVGGLLVSAFCAGFALLSEASFLALLALPPPILICTALGLAQCKVELSSYQMQTRREEQRRVENAASAEAFVSRGVSMLSRYVVSSALRPSATRAADSGASNAGASVSDLWSTLLWLGKAGMGMAHLLQPSAAAMAPPVATVRAMPTASGGSDGRGEARPPVNGNGGAGDGLPRRRRAPRAAVASGAGGGLLRGAGE